MDDRKSRFVGVELYFQDLERAKQFYQSVVGLDLSEEIVGHHAKFDGPSGFLCLEGKGLESYPSRDKAVVFVQVEDLMAAVEAIGPQRMLQVETKGVEGGTPWAVLQDPEEHSVVLLQAKRRGGKI